MLKLKLKFNPSILIALVLFIAHSPLIQAVGVQPMVLEFDAKAGERYKFELTIFPEEQQRLIYLNLYQPNQALDGSVSFQKDGNNPYSPTDWIHLEKDRLVVPPGNPIEVTGSINVPFGAGGSYSMIVMVEPVVEDGDEGVMIILRYAVRITVNVERPGLRSDLKILNAELIADEDGKPLVLLHIENPSPFRFPISGESTIRDENRRLVERVTLKSIAAWESGHDSFAIYPETQLYLIAPVTAPIYGGKFYVQSFLSYDNSKQVIKTTEIEIAEDEFSTLWSHALLVEPQQMDIKIQPGGASTQIIQMENPTNEPILVLITAEDIVTDYDHSVFEHLETELRSEAEILLNPKTRARSILLIRAPRDLEHGGYYGKIAINVFSGEEEYLESLTIPINTIVGTKMNQRAQPLSLANELSERGLSISSVVLNSGNIHLNPYGIAELRDKNDNLIYTLSLTLPGEQTALLPSTTGFLTAEIDEALIIPGEYSAIVSIYEGQEKVGIGEFTLFINEKEDSND